MYHLNKVILNTIIAYSNNKVVIIILQFKTQNLQLQQH